MRAVLCTRWGEPEDLEIAEIPAPDMVDGGVRIAVKAAGVNFADTLAIQGKYQVRGAHPFSPGLEGAGEVLEVAPGVSRVRPGDRVVFNGELGAWAEEVVFHQSQVWKAPDAIDWILAGGFPVVYVTSYLGLWERGALKAGDWLMVHGAGGGVGLTAVEIGKILGATVIATAGSDEKLALAREYGADHTVNYTTEDLRSRVKDLTGGRGCDVIYDPVGGDVFDASIRCVAWGGRILTLGFASGRIPQAPCNILLVKHASVMGHFVGSYRQHAPDLLDAAYRQLFDWLEAGKIRPHVSHVLDLKDVASALRLLLTRKSTGKVVLSMGG